MSVLVLEPVGGIAGDMLVAALLQLGAPRAALDEGLRALALPGLSLETREVEVSGIRALHFDVRVDGDGHAHRPWREIRDLLSRARLPPRAAELARSAFALLAEAEGRIHGLAAELVEFHEVGAADSIVDTVGAALLIDALAPERIVSLPPPAGGGTTRSAHGVIPVPAPATLEVLRGRTLRPSGAGERTTPTGAAMLAAWTEEAAAFPELIVRRIGYGAGTRRWEDAPNLLRAVLGEAAANADREAAWVLEANLDDLSPQLIAAALEAVLSAGALDAWVSPATMKKGRPGHLFGALASDATRAAIEVEMFRQTSTLGIRRTRVERRILDRELIEVETAYGKVRVKVGRLSGAVINVAPEFEDCRKAAERQHVPLKEVMAAALSAFRGAR
ncbi:MAG TPA: nickel pincer cofactor biosynthesis protein LarC [Myxococcales bacterium]|nr:nickel pincer cofactor biosynthesis protein LarC [Myxococcales bacterium]